MNTNTATAATKKRTPRTKYLIIRTKLADPTAYVIVVTNTRAIYYESKLIVYTNKKKALKDCKSLNRQFGSNYKYTVLAVSEVLS